MAYNKEAQDKYRQKCKTKTIVLFPESDKDISHFLEQTDEPFSTLVKRLIREEMARQKSQNAES